VVKVLCYKSEGRWLDPSSCQWIFHLHKILPIALWPWGRLRQYQEYFPGGKGGRCVRLTTYHHPVPLSRNLGTFNFLEPSGSVKILLYLLPLFWGIACRWGWDFSHLFRTAPRSTLTLVYGVSSLFFGSKAAGYGVGPQLNPSPRFLKIIGYRCHRLHFRNESKLHWDGCALTEVLPQWDLHGGREKTKEHYNYDIRYPGRNSNLVLSKYKCRWLQVDQANRFHK